MTLSEFLDQLKELLALRSKVSSVVVDRLQEDLLRPPGEQDGG